MKWIELATNIITITLGFWALIQLPREMRGIRDGKKMEVYSEIFSSLIKAAEKSGVIVFNQLYKSPRDFSEKFTEYINELKNIVYPATEMHTKEQEVSYEQNKVLEYYEDNENDPIDELRKQEIMEQIEKKRRKM